VASILVIIGPLFMVMGIPLLNSTRFIALEIAPMVIFMANYTEWRARWRTRLSLISAVSKALRNTSPSTTDTELPMTELFQMPKKGSYNYSSEHVLLSGTLFAVVNRTG